MVLQYFANIVKFYLFARINVKFDIKRLSFNPKFIPMASYRQWLARECVDIAPRGRIDDASTN